MKLWSCLRACLASLLLVHCAATAAQHVPLPSPVALRSRMQAAHSPVHGYSAEARLTYFGPDGRLKGTASLLVQRPDKLRYELQGPQGGVLLAVASDGNTLVALDLRDNRFVRGPANAVNFNKLFSLAPLDLDSAGWVDLLFGDVAIPADAQLSKDAPGTWSWQWQRGPRRLTAQIDAETAQVQAAAVYADGVVVSAVKVLARDSRGLPATLHLSVPGAKIEVEVRLRDVSYDPEVEASTFLLSPPRGVSTEDLSPR